MNHESVDDNFYDPEILILIWRKHDIIVGLSEESSASIVTWLGQFEIEQTRNCKLCVFFF